MDSLALVKLRFIIVLWLLFDRDVISMESTNDATYRTRFGHIRFASRYFDIRHLFIHAGALGLLYLSEVANRFSDWSILGHEIQNNRSTSTLDKLIKLLQSDPVLATERTWITVTHQRPLVQFSHQDYSSPDLGLRHKEDKCRRR